MNNIQRLGNTLAERMLKTARAANTISTELGIINSNMSLSTDTFRTPIPRGSYMINRALVGGYQAGDRVLVAWCGNEPVVIAVVTRS